MLRNGMAHQMPLIRSDPVVSGNLTTERSDGEVLGTRKICVGVVFQRLGNAISRPMRAGNTGIGEL